MTLAATRQVGRGLGCRSMGPGSTLKTGLLAYWPMNEASGNRVDVHGGYVFADNYGAGYNTGKVYANVLEMLDAGNEGLTCSSPGALNFADVDFTIALWYYPYSFPLINTYQHLYRTGRNIFTGGFCIKIAYNSQLAFIVFNSSSLKYASVHCPIAAINAWYFCVFSHDTTNNKVYASSNNSIPNEVAWSYAMSAGTEQLKIGREDDPADFRLGPIAVWNRVLSADERTALYNGGNGLPYASL